MNTKKAIVMVGNLSEGYYPVGPFEDMDKAALYCEEKGLGSLDSWIMELAAPSDDSLEDGA